MSFYPKTRVGFARGGLVLAGKVVPLYAGSVHYWRLERDAWKPALLETKKLGLRFIDTYVPWAIHETAPGRADFGEGDPRLDVLAFLRLIKELGLYAIVRPGPHINAELTFFGIPERVIWNPDCQARSPENNPVMLPMVPVGFPVPSYASEAFLLEVERWFSLVGPLLAPLRYPEGPIVLLQVDNEGTFYFRDGLYDQDYRPEAILLYRAFLQRKYTSDAALAEAYGQRARPFGEALPPTLFEAQNADDLAFHLDWAEFQEHLVAESITRMRKALVGCGLSEIPTFHNMTMGHEATPLTAARLEQAVNLVGLDYYHRATPIDRLLSERRTTELATRTEGLEQPSFACEMGAGFPPYFFPVHDEADSRFNVMTALAYGLRGFNIYMAVERDRWIGAPIDASGRPRPFAAFWTRLVRALEEVRFHELVRRTPVRIVNAALKRRLNRALHAFSPATPAVFAVLGSGSRESCFEEDFGLGGAVAGEVDAFIECFERALSKKGVPFAHADGETPGASLVGARWIIFPTAGGANPALWEQLRQAADRGAVVTIGPRVPARDGSLRALREPLNPDRFRIFPGTAAHPHFDALAGDEAVESLVRELSLPVLSVEPAALSATLHEDAAGAPRLLFVINPTSADERASVTLNRQAALVDVLEGTRHTCPGREVVLVVPARTVQMLRIDLA